MGGEGKGDDAPGRDAPPPLLTFPCVGPVKAWDLTAQKAGEYQTTYPSLDVPGEARKAWQWCQDNPANRKTARGMPAFLSRWFSRAQDRGGRRGAGAGPIQDTGPYRITDETHRLICAYKVAIGLDWKDRAWDRNCLTDEIRAAAQGLLEAFDGRGVEAAKWLQWYAAEMKGKGFTWTMKTAKDHAWRTKGERASAAHHAEGRGQAPPRAQRPLGEAVIDKKPTGFTSGADLTAGLLPQESHFEP